MAKIGEGTLTTSQSDLHRHALDNKHLQLADILENSSNKLEELKCKSDGLSVLQVACKVKSLNVIDQISRLLEQADFITCIKQLSDDGDSALHIAVKEDDTEVLHKLLTSVRDHSVRSKLVEHVKETVELSNRSVALKQLVRYHSLISRGCLKEFFYNFTGSLFSIELGKGRIKTMYDRISQEDYRIDNLGILRRWNGCATTCLLHNDLERAKNFVDRALAQEKHDIHTLCNHGVLLMKQNSCMSIIQATALRILESMFGLGYEKLDQANRDCRNARCKIDYAYWMAESDRTSTSREKSYEVFKEHLENPKLKQMREYCSYYYLKIKIRQVRDQSKQKTDPQHTKKSLHTAIDLLINLSQSTNDAYRGDMWLWLSELQSKAVSKDYWPELSDKFHTETEIEEEISSETCVNKAIEIAERASDKKFVARIAKNCLQCGYQCPELLDQIHWFKQAQNISEKWIRQNGPLFMCASTCAEALLQIWVIEFYLANKEFVHGQYQMYYTEQHIESVSDRQMMYYLTTIFSSRDKASESNTVKYLKPAREHLMNTLLYPDGWAAQGIKYARIKTLLGDPEDEIKEVFRRTIYESKRGVWRAKAYQHYGYYFHITKRPEQAKMLWKEAIYEGKLENINRKKLDMAYRGLGIRHRGQQHREQYSE